MLKKTNGLISIENSAIILARTANNQRFKMVELNQLLLELESNLKWEGATKEWKERRSSWVSDVAASVNLTYLAELLVELESNLQWELVDTHWKERADSWVEECRGASIVQEVSSLLLELESNINSEAMADEWPQNRFKWIQQLHKYNET